MERLVWNTATKNQMSEDWYVHNSSLYLLSRLLIIFLNGFLIKDTITLPLKIYSLIETSDLESTQKCQGYGKVIREKAPDIRCRQ